jgi:hypothetical protein
MGKLGSETMICDIMKMCQWEREKAVFLMSIAEERFNLDLEGYGELGMNENSGNVYLWLEDSQFTLFMPVNCELKLEDVQVMVTDINTGEEFERDIMSEQGGTVTVDTLEKWACEVVNK